ncbi:hypothetical protein PTKIN_Ptkin12aG0180600 [Pterospermum kingtungense]
MIKRKSGGLFKVNFKYELLGTFCFICGLLGHLDRFCSKLFETDDGVVAREWSPELRVDLRRNLGQSTSKWLRIDNMEAVGRGYGGTAPWKEERRDVRSIKETGTMVSTSRDSSDVTMITEDAVNMELVRMSHSGLGSQLVKGLETDFKGKSISSNQQLDSPLIAKVDPTEKVAIIEGSKNEDSVMDLTDDRKRRRGLPGSMSTLSWNCRGLGHTKAVLVISELVRAHKPNLIILFETLAHKNKIDEVRVKLGYGACFSVDCIGHSGGIGVIWKDQDSVSIKSFSRFHVDMEVTDQVRGRWRLTAFYGQPDRSQRRQFWELLRLLYTQSPLPLCCIGDFNDMLCTEEKR